MSEKTIQDRIKGLISNEVLVGVSADEINDDSALVDDLHLDSIQMIELITGLENEFDIVLEDEDLDLEFFSTVNSLAEFVQKKINQS